MWALIECSQCDMFVLLLLALLGDQYVCLYIYVCLMVQPLFLDGGHVILHWHPDGVRRSLRNHSASDPLPKFHPWLVTYYRLHIQESNFSD